MHNIKADSTGNVCTILRPTVHVMCAQYFNGKVQNGTNKKGKKFLSAGYISMFYVCTHVCTYVYAYQAARRSELVSSANTSKLS